MNDQEEKQKLGNAVFSLHYHTYDWCHLCGQRKEQPLVDIFCPENAEHGGPKLRYHRICKQCIVFMQIIVSKEHDPAGIQPSQK